MNRIKGFTLIELLVVIAIIAILAAIAFPVYSRVKDSANRSSDSTNMGALATALALYKVDQGGYPPAILGYATLYYPATFPVNATEVVPAGTAINFLYPRRVGALDTFRPKLDQSADNVYTTAFWPTQDPRPVRSSAYLDLNGDGIVDNNPSPTTGGTDSNSVSDCASPTRYYDDDYCSRQQYGVGDQVKRSLTLSDYNFAVSQNQDPRLGNEAIPTASTPTPIPSYFYNIDGYDVATVKVPGGTHTEIHYALFWSVWALSGGNGHDDRRQLGYADPPDSTVITWDSYFRNYDSNDEATRDKRDIVLFLGGGAIAKDSKDVSDRSWRITP